MKPKHMELESEHKISRRDFINGIAALSAAALFPVPSFAKLSPSAVAVKQSIDPSYYPPSSAGLRGNHPGAFEVLHELAMTGKNDWGSMNVLEEHYDLVVVGAGISGLSAAHFYRQKHPNARVLILDNHDDFGGHAKRNEFTVGEQTIIGYGGSQTLQEPNFYSDTVKNFLTDIGVDLKKLAAGYDTGFFEKHGLRPGLHFDHAKWGVNQFIAEDLGYFDGYMPYAKSNLAFDDAISQFPISQRAQTQLKGLFNIEEDQLSHLDEDSKFAYLYEISYRDFLAKHCGITEQSVFDVLEFGSSDVGVGLSALPALVGLNYNGLPGWKATGLPDEYQGVGYKEPYVHHFPDGNASIARLLVRKMIPAVAPGNTMEDIVTAHFDYSKLDVADAPTRLRLSSPVVNVVHEGEPSTSTMAKITYVNQNNRYQITANNVIMACNNRVIPKLCPELPKKQKDGLSKVLKTPILYTSVLLSNWRAFKKLGIGGAISPHGYYVSTSLDFPMSIGDYEFSQSPDEPVIVHLERFPYKIDADDLSDHDQFRAGRMELFTTPYDVIEQKTREQLNSLLGPGGFDDKKDILAITVNRWSHGYSAWYNPLFSETYDDDDDARYPHIIGRQPFGVIRIAGNDSAARAMMEASVEQAHRAVNEIT